MRCISFQHTAAQILARTKTVTRREGWSALKSGTLLQACERCRGVPTDERRELAIIRVVDVRREPLDRLRRNKSYGANEVRLEGFADDPRFPSPAAWVEWYCGTFGHAKHASKTIVTRIEFEYV